MDNRLYKKILLSLLSLFLIIGCVTYQPQKADAIAGKIASYAAKKAAVWVAKETAEESIEKILKKKIDIADPLFQKYISRVDYDLVQVDGKTFLLRNNLGSADKKALGDQIGKVVDRMMYGENAAWLSWVDWWSIGPALLVGNIIYSEMTDENYSFINEVLMQALIDLGFLREPETNFTDSVTKEPIKHYETPPAVKEPDPTSFNKNYAGKFTIPVGYSSTSANYDVMSEIDSRTTTSPYSTTVLELVPNKSVTKLTDTVLLAMEIDTYGLFSLQLLNTGLAKYNSFSYGSGTADIYRNGMIYKSGVPENDVPSHLPLSEVQKMNRFIWSYNTKVNTAVMILESTVDSSVPNYRVVYKTYLYPRNPTVHYVTPIIRLSTELKNVGATLYWDYFTDRVITPPTPRPAPQLKDVIPSNPKEYISGPVINNNPNTGKPTMAIPTTTIVQDPTKNPVKPDPQGGIIISKPDGTPVTDPDVELEPVTNEPVVKPNPTTGEPEIIVKPNTPPEPATPPKTDTPTTEDPDTGDPDTGDPGTETPPTDPDDEDPTKVKWDKLKTIPTFMTTRFPFSLPWDIGRFLDAVFPDVTAISELSYEFPDIGGYDTSFEITIPEYFDPWMDFARAAFIYGFDISLVYAIYRLFGGAQ